MAIYEETCEGVRQEMSLLSTYVTCQTCHPHLPFTTSTYNPMDSLNVDTIGPLPPDQDGNSCNIVIIDRFSHWIELLPAKDATANSAAHALLKHIGRFGAPSQLLSDGGSQYVNELINELNELLTLIGI